jgi:ribose-phosphate pyrophosphokinase
VVECSKSRDVKTGKLTGFKVYAEDLEGKDCLIVDDICDGGGTFIGLAGELKKKNAGNLYLAVTHGIFSKGFEELEKCFDKIFTTDSFKEINHNCLTQIKIDNRLLS